jgi:hypothetical protein
MVLGLNPFVAMLSVGFLAVAFYRQREPVSPLRAGIGARLGAMSGLFFFGMSTALVTLRVIFLHEGDELRRKLLEQVQQAAARYPDPQYQAGLDFFRSPAGLVFMVIFLLVFLFLACLVLGALGGVLGGTILGRRDKP